MSEYNLPPGVSSRDTDGPAVAEREPFEPLSHLGTHIDRKWCAYFQTADDITDLLDDLDSETPEGILKRLKALRDDLRETREKNW